jgi:hypothetical protein
MIHTRDGSEVMFQLDVRGARQFVELNYARSETASKPHGLYPIPEEHQMQGES